MGGQAQRARVSGRPHHAFRFRSAGGCGRAAHPDQPRRRDGRWRHRRRRMRLQLITLVVLLPSAAWAEGDGEARVTLFRESSSRNDGITVVHPQADFGADMGTALHFSAGYNADIVSGATPAIFGPSKGPDAITSATKFSDTRHAAHASFDYTSGTAGLSAGYDYATEHDYQSNAVSVGAHGDLF